MTVNGQLLDRGITHQLYLEALKTHEADAMGRLLGELSADLVRRLERIRTPRLEALHAAVQGIGREWTATLGKMADARWKPVAVYESDFWNRAIRGSVPVAVSLTQPSPQQLWAAAMDRPFEGAVLKDHFARFTATTQVELDRAVRLGFAEGQGMPDIMRRIRGTRAAGYTDGILAGITSTRATALTRTAVQHVAAAARDRLFSENQDLVKGVEWVATLDSRTTYLCASRDGKVYPADDHPEIPAHWNCRSTLIPVVASWEELGLDPQAVGAETRASMDGYAPASTKFEPWLRTKPESFQQAYLGMDRWGKWTAGTPLADFAKDTFGGGMRAASLAQIAAAEAAPVDPVSAMMARIDEARGELSRASPGPGRSGVIHLAQADPATLNRAILKAGDALDEEITRRAGGFKAAADEAHQAYLSALQDLNRKGNALDAEWVTWRKAHPDIDIIPDDWAKRFNALDTVSEAVEAARRRDLAAKSLASGARRGAFQDIMPTLRKMGGDPIPGSQSQVAGAVRAAADLYPADWIDSSLSYKSAGLKIRSSRARAQYSFDGTLTTDGSANTTAHELAHRMEQTVPGLFDAEKAFYDARTAGEALVDIYKTGDEWGRPDKWYDLYAGKVYENTYGGKVYQQRALEVLSMGMGDLADGGLRMDQEYRRWLLGILSLL